jgi:hypothetical protein
MQDDGKNIKQVIDKIFAGKGRLSHSFNQHTVEDIWRKTFGDVISSYTTRVSYNKEILTVYISSAPLREEISMHRESVIKKLNDNLQYRKVKELRIR